MTHSLFINILLIYDLLRNTQRNTNKFPGPSTLSTFVLQLGVGRGTSLTLAGAHLRRCSNEPLCDHSHGLRLSPNVSLLSAIFHVVTAFLQCCLLCSCRFASNFFRPYESYDVPQSNTFIIFLCQTFSFFSNTINFVLT